MAKEYPRFIFSNPKNTKSKGPFVIHTLDPFIICSVNRDPYLLHKKNCISDGKLNIVPLNIDHLSDHNKSIVSQMLNWVSIQLELRTVDF
jgi:hypothetical protein